MDWDNIPLLLEDDGQIDTEIGRKIRIALVEYDRQHLAEHHSRCPVCVIDDDPPTLLSGTMEPEFKLGDLVECIINADAQEFLTEGNIYSVQKVYELELVVNGRRFAKSRFRIWIPMPERCECDIVTSNQQWLRDRAAKFCPWCGKPLNTEREE